MQKPVPIRLNKWSEHLKKRETELARLVKSWKKYQESLQYLTGKIRPLFPYYGGKVYLAKDILSLIPDHKVYVEAFGGSGTILFYKKPSKLEAYNDTNKRLVNIFAVLKDENLFMSFLRELLFTPYSTKIFYEYLESVHEQEEYEIPDLRKAIRDFYLLACSVNASAFSESGGKSTGMSRVVSSSSSSSVHKYYSRLAILEYFHARITNVHIENEDALTLMDRYDSEDTFMYLDPPYHPYTVAGRKQKYEHDFSLEKHREMVKKILGMKSRILLSGYDNPDYEELELNGWYKVVIHTISMAGSTVCDNSLVIDGEVKSFQQSRTECLWLNYWHDNLRNYGYEKEPIGMLYQ